METKKNTGLKILAIALVIVLVGLWTLILTGGSIQTQPGQVEEQVPQVKEEAPALQLRVTSEKNTYRVGELVEVDVLADSLGEDIVAYDVLVSYGKSGLRLNNVLSGSEFHDVLSRNDQESHLTVTGAKKTSVSGAASLSNTSLLKLNFTPTTRGTFSVSVLTSSGGESTKLVNEQNKVIKPQVSSIEITIQ